MHVFMYTTPTFITEVLHFVTQVLTALNDCYSELMPYIALAYSYWISVYDTYQYQGYAH